MLIWFKIIICTLLLIFLLWLISYIICRVIDERFPEPSKVRMWFKIILIALICLAAFTPIIRCLIG